MPKTFYLIKDYFDFFYIIQKYDLTSEVTT
jgi:hypothetical protein